MSQYIPDLTERFPEGFGGVDMTPSFFGEPVDWSRAYKEYDDDEIPFPAKRFEKKFEIGQRYNADSIFGIGWTTYIVKKINRNTNKILLAEEWHDVDGNGTRPAEWYDLIIDDNNYESVCYLDSKTYGKFYIYAYTKEIDE